MDHHDELYIGNDNLPKFMHDWDYMIQGLTNVPDDEHLEYFFRRQLNNCPQLKDMMRWYQTEHDQHDKPYDYQVLRRIVRNHLKGQKDERLRNDLAMN